MNITKDELKNLIEELSEEESRLVFKFTKWLIEQGDELTDEELALLHQGEQEFEKGEYTWWRNAQRTEL